VDGTATGQSRGRRFRPSAFSSRAAPVSKPIPLWILYPLFFVAVYWPHFPLLRLPYFWDEAGYYIPAALDFSRTGALIPHSTLTNAHPPLPSILLAGWWHVAGYSINGTRTFLCIVAAVALLGVFRLARMLGGTLLAVAVCAMTLLYPVWFSQSCMAHADLFAAAFTLWALGFFFARYVTPGHNVRNLALAAFLFCCAALAKETSIVTPVVLALWEISLLATRPRHSSRAGGLGQSGPAEHASPKWVLALLTPLLPLVAWYAYHFHKTGFVFGNPEFLRYNATANLSALRVLLSLWHRFSHLTLHMGLWVPILATLALLFTPRLPGRTQPVLERPVLPAILVVIAGNALAFSVLGGALLTRYLLPVYPLEFLLLAALWQQRLRNIWPIVGLSLAAFVAALFLNPPYSFAPEDNLTWRDFVLLQQQGIGVIQKRFPAATVLTAWPAVTELEHPDLGYVRQPFAVDSIENFSPAQIEKASQDPGGFDTALVFSTKWTPPAGRWSFTRATQSSDVRFFDFHRDMSPQQIATLLHGEIVWQGYRNGEWAAVLHFPRIVQARLQQPCSTDNCR
jgi:4-amino-4-deoxy-L-arabinose transferase-like glycosyltransferase